MRVGNAGPNDLARGDVSPLWLLIAVALAGLGAWSGCESAPPTFAPLDSGPPPRDGPALFPLPATNPCLANVDLTPGHAALMPMRLSETGCFADVATRAAAAGLVPYDVNAPLYTDDAIKERYVALPPGERIALLADGTLEFPVGTILIKTFSVLEDDRRPETLRVLETRFVIRGAVEWGFFTYRYDADGLDATLLLDAETETLGVERSGDEVSIDYRYPSRFECTTCHSTATERSLGFRIDQLNRVFNYDGVLANQLAAMDEIGMFQGLPADVSTLPALADPKNEGAPDEARARAYLHSNCSHCHRPLGQSSSALTLDLRIERTLEETHLCDPVQFFAPAGTLRVAPGDADASFIVQRMESDEPLLRMPPLGRDHPDWAGGVRAVRLWIARMRECP